MLLELVAPKKRTQKLLQVSTSVPLIEELSENDAFPARELAAAVASKVFFHLEEYNDALRLALGAGPYFDVSAKSEYVSTLVSKCIDRYVELRAAAAAEVGGGGGGGGGSVGVLGGANAVAAAGGEAAAAVAAAVAVDPRMEAIVERMFDRCYVDGEYAQAMGIALESRRLDKVEETIRRCPDQPALLAYTLDVCQTLVQSRAVRLRVLRVLVKLHREQPRPDHVAVCQCLQLLDEARLVAEILKGLICGGTGRTGGAAGAGAAVAAVGE
ncbi:unnamed protein product, partial [Phaeothamnion confervicola]